MSLSFIVYKHLQICGLQFLTILALVICFSFTSNNFINQRYVIKCASRNKFYYINSNIIMLTWQSCICILKGKFSVEPFSKHPCKIHQPVGIFASNNCHIMRSRNTFNFPLYSFFPQDFHSNNNKVSDQANTLYLMGEGTMHLFKNGAFIHCLQS